jgi:hypothetical protein
VVSELVPTTPIERPLEVGEGDPANKIRFDLLHLASDHYGC